MYQNARTQVTPTAVERDRRQLIINALKKAGYREGDAQDALDVFAADLNSPDFGVEGLLDYLRYA